MKTSPSPTPGGVFISLGGSVSLKVDDNGELFIVQATKDQSNDKHIHLGRATSERFEDLQTYTKRLSIHAV